MEDIIKRLTENPQKFLTKDKDMYNGWMAVAEHMFKKACEARIGNCTLSQLYIEGFDAEGIWNQIELLNHAAIPELQAYVDSLPSNEFEEENEETLTAHMDTISDSFNGEDEGMNDINESEMSDCEEFEEEEMDLNSNDEDKTLSNSNRKSVVDDDFFSLEEMERFAELGEQRDLKMAKMNHGDLESGEDDEDMFSIGKGITIKH